MWVCAGEYKGAKRFNMFCNYTAAKAAVFQKETAFKNYVSEGIRMITHIIAEQYGGEYLGITYDNIVHPKPKTKSEDTKQEAKNRLALMGIEVKPNGSI